MINYKKILMIIFLSCLLIATYGCSPSRPVTTEYDSIIYQDIPGSWNMSSAELMEFLNEHGFNADLDTKLNSVEIIRFHQTEKIYIYRFENTDLVTATLMLKPSFDSEAASMDFIVQLEDNLKKFLDVPDILIVERPNILYKVMQKDERVVLINIQKNYKQFMALVIFYNPNNPFAKRVWPELQEAGYVEQLPQLDR